VGAAARRAAGERAALRARYHSARHAAWAEGAARARAGAGFAGQADLAALFTERGVALTRPGGTVALLLPAKLWRTLAGGGLRALLLRETRLLALEDWSHAPAAFDAATYPSLLLAARAGHADGAVNVTPDAPRVRVTVHQGRRAATACVAASALACDSSPAAPWVLLPPEVRARWTRCAPPARRPRSCARRSA
jgi:hypothetical protein